MKTLLDLLALFEHGDTLLQQFTKNGILSKIHFVRWSGSQAKGGASGHDEKYSGISAAHIREDGLNTVFTFAFVTADGKSRVLTGTRPLHTGKGAVITLDNLPVSDAASEITYKPHSHSLQIDFKFKIDGKDQDFRTDGYLL